MLNQKTNTKYFIWPAPSLKFEIIFIVALFKTTIL